MINQIKLYSFFFYPDGELAYEYGWPREYIDRRDRVLVYNDGTMVLRFYSNKGFDGAREIAKRIIKRYIPKIPKFHLYEFVFDPTGRIVYHWVSNKPSDPEGDRVLIDKDGWAQAKVYSTKGLKDAKSVAKFLVDFKKRKMEESV